ncbi:hypothetical protein HHK36_024466 [Tetracentron sinense]|uniref:CRAL-TRIO domain-containing protein n=1 Tax=Tetracentron sinense TaxID=13715 RepID=A0A834YQQ2_TETSI|nr:hypothetical protein HHK36_024466 [Tetracentron sinense]
MERNQEIAVIQMRKSVEKLGSSTEKHGDLTLVRFLVARSMDSDKAAKMFVQWQKWRAGFVPLGFIPDSEIPDELEARKIYLQDLSRVGYPVLIIKANKHFPSSDHLQFKSISLFSFLFSFFISCTPFNLNRPIGRPSRGKFVVHLLDKTIASSFKGREIGNEKLVGILDLQQIAFKNIDARGLITGFQFLQAYYPERLAKLFILNMPWFFVSVWRMVSRFLEKATLEKVVIVTNDDERKDLIKEIGEETLPEEYGGRAKLVALQDVKLSHFLWDE